MPFLAFRGAIVTAALLALPVSGARAEVAFDGVAAGDPSASDVILWTRAENGGAPIELKAQIATDASFANIVEIRTGATSAAADFTVKLPATDLAGNTRYFYRFFAPDGSTSATGQFTTAPAPNDKAEVRFAFSGDADGRFRPYPSIRAIAEQKLNYFVFIGDTMYETADGASPAVPVVSGETTDRDALATALTAYNQKYLNNVLGVDPTGRPSNSGQQSLQPMFAATASYTLLDNHELGNRSLQSGGAPPNAPQGTPDPAFDVNTTGNYNNKTLAFQTIAKSYLDYHPTRVAILGAPATGYALVGPQVTAPADPRSNGTPQLYFAQQWGANSIYVQTDDRSYRDIRLAKLAGNRTIDDVGNRADNPARTMLGSTQLQWLEATLLQAQQDRIPWKFVAISSPIDQVGGAPVQDGKSWWGGYRAERDRLLKFIADNRIGHVVFLTTDDHQTRVTQLQYLRNPGDPNSKALLTDAFQVVTGPIGAGGPDKFADHSFAAIQIAANRANERQVGRGQPPLGLPANFPGLHGVFRQGDPDAAATPSPVDFYSPDTFNYTVLTVAADGGLTVETWGIPSYPENTFPHSTTAPNVILGFQIGLTEGQ
jgi:phosphodiesterase/alkaline phosphatase D-like protein